LLSLLAGLPRTTLTTLSGGDESGLLGTSSAMVTVGGEGFSGKLFDVVKMMSSCDKKVED
jgi:hypothetical protein